MVAYCQLVLYLVMADEENEEDDGYGEDDTRNIGSSNREESRSNLSEHKDGD